MLSSHTYMPAACSNTPRIPTAMQFTTRPPLKTSSTSTVNLSPNLIPATDGLSSPLGCCDTIFIALTVAAERVEPPRGLPGGGGGGGGGKRGGGGVTISPRLTAYRKDDK